MIANLEPLAGRVVTLATIEQDCQSYNREADKLDGMIAELEADLETVKRKHLKALKAQAAAVATAEAELHNHIEANPALFTKPRTHILHGVKAGLMTSNGKLVWDMEDADLVEALKRRFREDDAWRDLVATREVPRKDALKQLDEATLARLGCRIEGAGDVVVIKRTAGDVEKMMDRLIEKMVGDMVGGE